MESLYLETAPLNPMNLLNTAFLTVRTIVITVIVATAIVRAKFELYG